jgi:acyl dehydratase
VKFHRPVYSDDTILLEWQVMSVEESAYLKGEVVELRGRISNGHNQKVVSATGRVLVMEKT